MMVVVHTEADDDVVVVTSSRRGGGRWWLVYLYELCVQGLCGWMSIYTRHGLAGAAGRMMRGRG